MINFDFIILYLTDNIFTLGYFFSTLPFLKRY